MGEGIKEMHLVGAIDVQMMNYVIAYVENSAKWVLNTDTAVADGVPAGWSSFVRVKLKRAGPNTSEIMKTHSQTMRMYLWFLSRKGK